MTDSYTMDEFFETRERDQHIDKALSTLGSDTFPGREEKVLRMRFGFAPYNDGPYEGGYTLEHVGHLIGVTRERVRQIEAKALRRLRHPEHSSLLKIFLGN